MRLMHRRDEEKKNKSSVPCTISKSESVPQLTQIKDPNQLLRALRHKKNYYFIYNYSFYVLPFLFSIYTSFFHMYVSVSFNGLVPLIFKANIRLCVLMIVSIGHSLCVKLLLSKEVNTPNELWLFQSADGIPHDSHQKAVTKSFMRKQFIKPTVNIVKHTLAE